MFLTRDQILAATDLKMEKVSIPEWGGSVFVKEMNVRERIEWEQRAETAKNGADAIFLLLSMTVCDEGGQLLLSLADVSILEKKSPNVMLRLNRAAERVNKITKEDVEALAKNSSAAHPDDSSSS